MSSESENIFLTEQMLDVSWPNLSLLQVDYKTIGLNYEISI